jgi:hypothetical protein
VSNKNVIAMRANAILRAVHVDRIGPPGCFVDSL